MKYLLLNNKKEIIYEFKNKKEAEKYKKELTIINNSYYYIKEMKKHGLF